MLVFKPLQKQSAAKRTRRNSHNQYEPSGARCQVSQEGPFGSNRSHSLCLSDMWFQNGKFTGHVFATVQNGVVAFEGSSLL